jgi:hypothetical protein
MNWQPKDLGLSYEEAAHGIQSAIAHEIGLGRKVITPKHMREPSSSYRERTKAALRCC